MEHLKRNWKKYAALAVGVAALYYGVQPEKAQEAFQAFLAVFSK